MVTRDSSVQERCDTLPCLQTGSLVHFFLRSVLNLEHVTGSNEFGSSRGAIHSHLLLYTNSETDKQLDTIMGDWAMAAMGASILRDEGKAGRSGMGHLDVNELADIEETFQEALSTAQSMAADNLATLLTQDTGLSASHQGTAPADWLMAAGREAMGYRSSYVGMLKRRAVLDTNEVSSPKYEREEMMYARTINLRNQCLMHCCSDYCWRFVRNIIVPFNPSRHTREQKIEFQGNSMAKVAIYECRFGFGQKQIFDSSGHGNLTEGKTFIQKPYIELDTNQQPRLYVSRNHPRVLQQPVTVYHWGCNSDMQRLLTNNSSYSRVQAQGKSYEAFVEHMLECGTFGLEQYSSSECINRYVTSYNTKGNKSSASWTNTLYDLTKDASTSARSLFSITFKFMNEMSKSRSLSRDEASFVLAGGKLPYNTMPTYKASVKNVDLDELSDNKKSVFTWKKLIFAYKARPLDLDRFSLYIFASKYFITKNRVPVDIVPHFFGYVSEPSWPLEEDYSKWQLIFHHPWRDSVDSLAIDGKFVPALEAFMWSGGYPTRSAVAILRKKLKWTHSETTDHGMGRNAAGTTNSDSQDSQLPASSQNEEAAEAPEDITAVAEDSGAWTDAYFAALPDGGPDHDWSARLHEQLPSGGANIERI